MPHPREVSISYNKKQNVIDFHHSGTWHYDVDMNNVYDARSALDWIRQLSEKNWMDIRNIYIVSNMMMMIIEGKTDGLPESPE